MFIKVKDYLIPVNRICYIKRVGWGLRIVTETGTIDIADLSEEDYNSIIISLTNWGFTRLEEVES